MPISESHSLIVVGSLKYPTAVQYHLHCPSTNWHGRFPPCWLVKFYSQGVLKVSIGCWNITCIVLSLTGMADYPHAG